ncbi:T9SS type A sorting domain-containing protein, partial [bacterium]|nr:T9SS type A sorting domain-containing protein [bacterium]
YFIETSEWWVKNYDVDGFRCDVAWGVQQRHDDFWVDWRERLKRIRPEILLLGEANARESIYFDNRFDLVYDWYLHHEASQSFASMFDGSPNPQLLHAAILNNGDGFAPYKAPFRFLENHDEDRFIANHTVPQTKLALSILMTIPGVPMIYAGEEWGEATRRDPLQRVNQEGMYEHVYNLIRARRALPALTSPDITMVGNSMPTAVYAFSRYENGEVPVVVIHNLTDSDIVNLAVNIDLASLGLVESETYYLNDMLSNTRTQVAGEILAALPIDLAPYQSFVYAISDTAIILDVKSSSELPGEFSLAQNYPNPFNPATTIQFSLPENVNVQIHIYNLLGQRVASLVNSRFPAGIHSISWDGSDANGRSVAAGMYIYQIKAGSFIDARKMLLLK